MLVPCWSRMRRTRIRAQMALPGWKAFINTLSFYIPVFTPPGVFCIRGDFRSGVNRSPVAKVVSERDDHAPY